MKKLEVQLSQPCMRVFVSVYVHEFISLCNYIQWQGCFYPSSALMFLFLVVQGYAIIEGRPFQEPRLPCCGIGMGWFL